MANHGDFQLGIYRRGLAGERESLPLTFAELEARGAGAMSTELLAYVAGGARNEHTQPANVAAFDQLGLVPRMLVPAASTASTAPTTVAARRTAASPPSSTCPRSSPSRARRR